MKQNLQVYSLSTGALLLATDQGALLMGGGLPTELLKEQLRDFRTKLVGILIPNEHSQRLRGLYNLAVDWELPLIGHWQIILHKLFIGKSSRTPPQLLTDLERNEWHCGNFHIEAFPVKYDSLHPYGWNVSVDGQTLSIVLDGRLKDVSLEALKKCDALILNNCRDIAPNDSVPLAKRKRSVYPTNEEQMTQLKQAGIFLPDFPVLPLKLYPSFFQKK